jgi:hypothetical protein
MILNVESDAKLNLFKSNCMTRSNPPSLPPPPPPLSSPTDPRVVRAWGDVKTYRQRQAETGRDRWRRGRVVPISQGPPPPARPPAALRESSYIVFSRLAARSAPRRFGCPQKRLGSRVRRAPNRIQHPLPHPPPHPTPPLRSGCDGHPEPAGGAVRCAGPAAAAAERVDLAAGAAQGPGLGVGRRSRPGPAREAAAEEAAPLPVRRERHASGPPRGRARSRRPLQPPPQHGRGVRCKA